MMTAQQIDRLYAKAMALARAKQRECTDALDALGFAVKNPAVSPDLYEELDETASVLVREYTRLESIYRTLLAVTCLSVEESEQFLFGEAPTAQ